VTGVDAYAPVGGSVYGGIGFDASTAQLGFNFGVGVGAGVGGGTYIGRSFTFSYGLHANISANVSASSGFGLSGGVKLVGTDRGDASLSVAKVGPELGGFFNVQADGAIGNRPLYNACAK